MLMGFDEDKVEKFLKLTNNQKDYTIELLMSGITPEEFADQSKMLDLKKITENPTLL